MSIKIYKNLNEYPDFEQNYYSRIAKKVYKNEHDNLRLMNWLAFFIRSFNVNINYYDLMGYTLKCLNEISQWLILFRSKRPPIQSSAN